MFPNSFVLNLENFLNELFYLSWSRKLKKPEKHKLTLFKFLTESPNAYLEQILRIDEVSHQMIIESEII